MLFFMSIIEKTFRTNEVIIKEGDKGDTFFRLVEGNVGVYTNYGKKEQFRVAFLKAGDYFGEMHRYFTKDKGRVTKKTDVKKKRT